MLTAAALAGKLIELIALFPIAVCRGALMLIPTIGDPIKSAMTAEGATDINPLDWAESYVLARKPKRHAQLQNIRNQAILAFGAGLLALAYGHHFSSQPQLRTAARVAFWLFITIGIFQSADLRRPPRNDRSCGAPVCAVRCLTSTKILGSEVGEHEPELDALESMRKAGPLRLRPIG
jgi:hypothetical protein